MKNNGSIEELFQKALEDAISNAKGWASKEDREDYIKSIVGDDDYLPPLFCETAEELERSGMAEAFTSLQLEGEEEASEKMIQLKNQGNEAFLLGKQNLANNKQYYRDAINYYYQAAAVAEQVQCITEETFVKPTVGPKSEVQYFTERQLNGMKSTIYANSALAHLQLKNWGHCREDATKALSYNSNNSKAWHRLAKAQQMLQNWEEAGDAIESGLTAITAASQGSNSSDIMNSERRELLKLQKLLEHRVRRARQERQKRERTRAERLANIKNVWKHCQKESIQLGRVPLVSTIDNDDDHAATLYGDAYDDDGNNGEFFVRRWNSHFPHTGKLPTCSTKLHKETHQQAEVEEVWSWPCMFLYPSHRQSDFIEQFHENELFALRLAQVFPEVNDDDDHYDDDYGVSKGAHGTTDIPWDYNNEFVCSKLAVYFEVHVDTGNSDYGENQVQDGGTLVHPESVELLKDLASTIRFYESSRALRGDEGPEMTTLARTVEQRHLAQQITAWRQRYKTLHHRPDPTPVVRVHPAVPFKTVLKDPRMVVPNFIPTFIIIPEDHPAHEQFLKEHKCIGIVQPDIDIH